MHVLRQGQGDVGQDEVGHPVTPARIEAKGLREGLSPDVPLPGPPSPRLDGRTPTSRPQGIVCSLLWRGSGPWRLPCASPHPHAEAQPEGRDRATAPRAPGLAPHTPPAAATSPVDPAVTPGPGGYVSRNSASTSCPCPLHCRCPETAGGMEKGDTPGDPAPSTTVQGASQEESCQ